MIIEKIGMWLAGGIEPHQFAERHVDDRVEAIVARVDGLEARVMELERKEPPTPPSQAGH